MTRLLLAILLLFIAVKLVVDSGTLVFKYAPVKLVVDDEEGKEKNDGQKDGKQDNEDFLYTCNLSHFAACAVTMELYHYSSTQQRLHKGFLEKPFTPPDVLYRLV